MLWLRLKPPEPPEPVLDKDNWQQAAGIFKYLYLLFVSALSETSGLYWLYWKVTMNITKMDLLFPLVKLFLFSNCCCCSCSCCYLCCSCCQDCSDCCCSMSDKTHWFEGNWAVNTSESGGGIRRYLIFSVFALSLRIKCFIFIKIGTLPSKIIFRIAKPANQSQDFLCNVAKSIRFEVNIWYFSNSNLESNITKCPWFIAI